MRINFCCFWAAMTHQLLNVAQVSTVFQQVRAKAVTKGMHDHMLLDAGFPDGSLKYLPYTGG